jgi:hypothetical protein
MCEGAGVGRNVCMVSDRVVCARGCQGTREGLGEVAVAMLLRGVLEVERVGCIFREGSLVKS